MKIRFVLVIAIFNLCMTPVLYSQIGKRLQPEKKVIKDPVTGIMLNFLTSKPNGDSKIYQTHSQWTADGEWVIFRSNRSRGEAMAVNEEDGDIVQLTEGGFTGMLCVARKSMKLYCMRNVPGDTTKRGGPLQIIEVDLDKLFKDSKA